MAKNLGNLNLLLATFFIILPISFRPLLDNNEGLYAEIAREMLESHNILIPTLNKVMYIEKPPLFFWFTALSFYIFGENELAARLPSAISAVLIILILSRFYTRYGDKRDIVTVVLSTSIGFYMMSQQVMTDMVFTLFNTLCLLYFFRYREERKPFFLYVSFLSAALACLTKGLIGIVLPFLIVALFIIIGKEKIPEKGHLIKGIIIFLLVFLPWHLYMSINFDDFFVKYFVEEHILRFLGKRMPHDYYTRPVYYIVSILLLGMLPWTHIAFVSLRFLKELDAFKLFLVIWIFSFVVFFTVSRCASSYYMLPCYPALSMFIAQNIDKIQKDKFNSALFISFPILSFIGIFFIMFLKKDDPLIAFGKFFIMVNFFAYGVFYILSWMYYRRQRVFQIFKYGFFMLGIFILTSLIFFNQKEELFSSRSIALELKRVLKDGDVVFMKARYEDYSSFPFYLKRDVLILEEEQKDLEYGIKKEGKRKIFYTMDDFIKFAETNTIYLLLEEENFKNFPYKQYFRVVMRSNDKVLITNSR